MIAEPLDGLLVELQDRLTAFVALVKADSGEDELQDAVRVVREASAALTEAVADRTGQLISLHYVFDEDDDSDEEPDGLVAPGVHITVEEVLRIVDEETLVRSAGISLDQLVANAGRYGLEPLEGATGVELIDISGE